MPWHTKQSVAVVKDITPSATARTRQINWSNGSNSVCYARTDKTIITG